VCIAGQRVNRPSDEHTCADSFLGPIMQNPDRLAARDARSASGEIRRLIAHLRHCGQS
jgi:hypothetical protein